MQVRDVLEHAVDQRAAKLVRYESDDFTGQEQRVSGGLGYDPERWGMYADMATVTNAIRHGNFDYLTDSQVWEPTISDHVIPSSYYLSGKPAFFGSRAWPWVQPDNTTQQIYSLPARDRYNAIPLPVLDMQPLNQMVNAGQTATFTPLRSIPPTMSTAAKY